MLLLELADGFFLLLDAITGAAAPPAPRAGDALEAARRDPRWRRSQYAAHAGGRDGKPAFPQLVGDADLTERRLLNGQGDNGVFDVLRHAVLQHRLLAADLLQKPAPRLGRIAP